MKLTATLVALLVLAVPATAAAETPSPGRYRSPEGVILVVNNTFGALAIESAAYHHNRFERMPIHAGSFEGCTRNPPYGPEFFREFCLHGTFGGSGHVSGTLKVYMGVHGRRESDRTIEAFHWKATLDG